MRFDVSHVEDNHGSILSPSCAVKRTAMESLAAVVMGLSVDTDSHDGNYHMACEMYRKNIYQQKYNKNRRANQNTYAYNGYAGYRYGGMPPFDAFTVVTLAVPFAAGATAGLFVRLVEFSVL